MGFSERLKELRQLNDKTQIEIAQIIEIHRNAYHNYERGLQEPSISVLIKLANFFNVSTDYLLGLSDSMNRH